MELKINQVINVSDAWNNNNKNKIPWQKWHHQPEQMGIHNSIGEVNNQVGFMIKNKITANLIFIIVEYHPDQGNEQWIDSVYPFRKMDYVHM